MPLTFLSHQAPVVPLKMAAPRWFDGTALAVGSMAPDIVSITRGTDWVVEAHTLAPSFWLCLPLTVVLTWAIKRLVAGPLALHLPDAGAFHLRDYARLDDWRLPTGLRGWLVLVSSALIGALSHLAFDAFTHSDGWVVETFAPLRRRLLSFPEPLHHKTLYLYDLVQIGGTLAGAAVTLWCIHAIGARRSLTEWCPRPPTLVPTAASRRRLAAGVAAGLVGGLVIAALGVHEAKAQPHTVRAAGLAFAGLVIGCVTARRAMGRAPVPAGALAGRR